MASSPVIIQVATPGPAGPAGPSGATGPAGYSPRYYVQSGVPTSGVGLAGDMYINSTNSDVWGPKIDNTTWPATPACNIRGIAGYSPLYIVAAGTPPGATGNIGDMYINSTTSDLYGPKSAGGWGPIVANLKGATGSTGPQGPPGVAAIPRGAWASGVLYNQGDLVTDASQSWICLVNHTSSAGNRPSLPSPATWQATAAGGTQTPWTTDIDGNTKKLNNAGGIGIGGAATSSKLGITAGALATTAGAGVIFHSSVAQTSNTDEFSTVLTRPTAGTDWTTAVWRLGRKVDSTDIASIEFGNSALHLRTAGVPRVTAAAAGVAIGLQGISPAFPLHISGPATADTISSAHQFHLGIDSNPAYGLQIGYLAMFGATISTVIQNWQGAPGGAILLQPSGGGVSIGGANPASRLHVGGPQNATGGISIATDTNDPNLYGYQIYRGPAGELNFLGNQAGAAAFVFGNPTERMRIAAGGNVGIGTAAPAGRLHVSSGSDASEGILVSGADVSRFLVIQNKTATGARIQQWNGGAFGNIGINPDGGNVGIGTAAPLNVFQVRGAANANLGIRYDTGLAMIGFGSFNDAGSAAGPIAYNATVHAFVGGNVGIGTAAPADLLTVGGITYAANSNGGIRIQSAGAEWAMRMALKSDSGGIPRGAFEFGGVELFAINGVGIAVKKAAAGYPVDVNGDINISGTYRVNGAPLATGGGGGSFTVQDIVTGSRLLGGIYNNGTSKPMLITVTVQQNTGNTNMLNVLTGTANPPTLSVILTSINPASGVYQSFTFVVLPGHWYQVSVTAAGSALIRWVEWY